MAEVKKISKEKGFTGLFGVTGWKGRRGVGVWGVKTGFEIQYRGFHGRRAWVRESPLWKRSWGEIFGALERDQTSLQKDAIFQYDPVKPAFFPESDSPKNSPLVSANEVLEIWDIPLNLLCPWKAWFFSEGSELFWYSAAVFCIYTVTLLSNVRVSVTFAPNKTRYKKIFKMEFLKHFLYTSYIQ